MHAGIHLETPQARPLNFPLGVGLETSLAGGKNGKYWRHQIICFYLQKILEDCDKDHSETITFEEFKDGMKSYMEFFLHE